MLFLKKLLLQQTISWKPGEIRVNLEKIGTPIGNMDLLIAAQYLRLSYLDKNDAVRLITEPVKNQLYYDRQAVELILKMTNGQPLSQMAPPLSSACHSAC